MSVFLQALARETAKAGIRLSDEQTALLERHFNLLSEWNARTNLTAITDPETAARLHYLDSLAGAAALAQAPAVETWVDVGAGGGFPGVPLAVMFHVERFVLAESKSRKSDFLKAAVAELGLAPRVGVFEDRIEARTVEALRATAGFTNWGMLCRAVEQFEKQLPKLLKLPGLRRALLWIGETDLGALAKRIPPGWNVEIFRLPSGDRRVLMSLTRHDGG